MEWQYRGSCRALCAAGGNQWAGTMFLSPGRPQPPLGRRHQRLRRGDSASEAALCWSSSSGIRMSILEPWFSGCTISSGCDFLSSIFFSLNDMFRRNAIYMKQAEGRMKASRQKRRRGPYLLPPVSPGSWHFPRQCSLHHPSGWK